MGITYLRDTDSIEFKISEPQEIKRISEELEAYLADGKYVGARVYHVTNKLIEEKVHESHNLESPPQTMPFEDLMKQLIEEAEARGPVKFSPCAFIHDNMIEVYLTPNPSYAKWHGETNLSVYHEFDTDDVCGFSFMGLRKLMSRGT